MTNVREHALYQVWKGMRSRCFNPHHSSYHRYGGRGIVVCEAWNDYVVFFEWSMANGYERGLSLDRIDNDASYSPDNCRWVTYKTQANNTSSNIFINAFEECKTISEWSDDIRCAVPLNTLYQRIESGWSPIEAIITPSQRSSTQAILTFDWYQAVAESTAIYPNKGTMGGLSYTALGLCSEVGELSGKIKKVMRDNNNEMTKDARKAILAELSDILWYCAATASELNMSLGQIAQDNLNKLASRKERGTLGGSGDSR